MTTKNNWLTTSLIKRTSDNLCDFSITINPHTFKKNSFKNNSKRVAKEICEKNENVFILYSGGIDSEYVLKVFLEEKLHVTPVIVVTPYNKLELEYAVKFCVENKIKPIIFKYEKREMFNIMQKICSEKGYFSFVSALFLEICDKITDRGGTLVTGNGEPFSDYKFPTPKYDETNIEDVDLLINFNEWDFYDHYHCGNHVGGFFTYDAALNYSMVSDAIYEGDVQHMKCKLYELPYRPKILWDKEFYIIFNALKNNTIKWNIRTSLKKYKTSFCGKEPTTFT